MSIPPPVWACSGVYPEEGVKESVIRRFSGVPVATQTGLGLPPPLFSANTGALASSVSTG